MVFLLGEVPSLDALGAGAGLVALHVLDELLVGGCDIVGFLHGGGC